MDEDRGLVVGCWCSAAGVAEAGGLLVVDELDQPQLLVRLTKDVGKLTAGLAYRLPAHVSNALIMRRKATPVGNMAVFPDLDI